MKTGIKARNLILAGVTALCFLTACAGQEKVPKSILPETTGTTYTGQENQNQQNQEELEQQEPETTPTAADPETEDGSVYEAFLRGETSAKVGERYYADISYLDPVKDEKNISLPEILHNVWSSIKEDRGIEGMERVEYALIDCGSDGIPELAVRAKGLSIYDMHDDSDLTMIFTCVDGQAELVYAVDTWARSFTDIYSDGYITGWGSGGAATHYENSDFIGADGVYKTIYDMHVETGQPIWGMTQLDWNWDEDGYVPVEFYECKLGEETVYAYSFWEEASEEQEKKILAYIAENEENMNTTFITWDELVARIAAREESFGVKEMVQAHRDGNDSFEIKWQTLEGCEEYLYKE